MTPSYTMQTARSQAFPGQKLASHRSSWATGSGRTPVCLGGGGCATIPVVDNVPGDGRRSRGGRGGPELFHAQQPVPRRVHAAIRGRSHRLFVGQRTARVHETSGLIWDASVSIGRSEVDQFIFDTVNASLGYDTPTSFEPGSYQQDEVNFNFRRLVPSQRHRARRGRHGVAQRRSSRSARAGSPRGRSARTPHRASAPARTALTATGPTRRREAGAAATLRSTVTSSSPTRATGGRSARPSGSRTSKISVRRRTANSRRALS